MPLTSGTRLGPYEIVGAIGAGGMGEVYRARDTRLGREVALKVLPESFAQNAQRMARFRREAQVLASLNHPNIAAIYGFEDSSNTHALVMELVEGPTLADRIQQGAIPIEEALPIAKQIAEALEYAHERGIVHRDLKPSNIKITPGGQAKVLDFGLAKAIEGDAATTSVESSPTMSAMATRVGFLLGTAAYMSPEQARGKAADRRADIWAFGVVLYEMLSGLRLFIGETTSDTLAAVIRAEPDWNALPANTPPAIRNLLRRCMGKDPRQRLQAIGDARIVLEEVLSGAPQDGASGAVTPAQTRWLRGLPWALAALLAVALAASFLILPLVMQRQPAPAIVAQIEPPRDAYFVVEGVTAGPPVLSPDGSALAFTAATSDGHRMLWLQELSSPAAHSLDGTDDAASPFWSADSKSLAFFAHGKLNRIVASGGPVSVVCDAPMGRGGTWGADGTILFAVLSGPIFRVAASGGAPEPMTKISDSSTSQRWPQFLPDGRHFLYLEQLRGPGSAVYAGSLDGGQAKRLLEGDSNAVYAPPGYLLFIQQGTLMAQRFDTAKLQLTGDAAPLAAHVSVDTSLGRGNFTVSGNGILAYMIAGSDVARLLWFDRSGKQLAETGTASVYGFPQISPDGNKLVVPTAQTGISVFDLVRGTSMRLTFTHDLVRAPAWSPNGKSIAYEATSNGKVEIEEKAADGTGATKPLVVDDADDVQPTWSSDGRYLIYQRLARKAQSTWEIWAKPLFGEGKAFPVLQNPPYLQGEPVLSPDGKWLVHDSDETGRFEVYVTPFLHGGGKWQVSADGGLCPRWRGDGREIFYLSLDDKIMSADISEQGPSVVIGQVRALFQAHPVPGSPNCFFDVTRDGKKFVIATQTAEGSRPLTLVVNWPALLKKQQ